MSRWHTTLCDRASDANVTKHKNVLGMPLNNSDDDGNNISNNNNNTNILKLILAIHHVNALLLNTMVDHLIVRWVARSIPHGGPIGLYLTPASAPQLV